MKNQVNFPELQYQKTTLSNGLTVLSIKRPTSGLVAFEAHVNVGSRYENQNNSGISHLVEHLNFKGTSKRTSKDISQEIENVGGSLNAATSHEETTYSTSVLKKYIDLAVDTLCDMMLNSTFPEAEVENEKKVVIQEIAQRQDDPSTVVVDNLMLSIYKDQPLGRSITGTIDSVDSLTREDIINFTNQYYIPSNIIFSAVGNIDHQEFVNLVEEKCVRASYPICENFEPANYTPDYHFKENSELSQTNVIISYEAVNLTSPEQYKYAMLSDILGNGFSSRLFQEVREKNALVYSVDTGTESFKDSGIFFISFSTTNDNLLESFTTISSELKRITYTITQQEIYKVIAQVTHSLYASEESNYALVSKLNSNYASFGRIISPNENFEGFSAVTIEDLHDLATKIFSSNVTISILGQAENIPSYDVLQDMLIIKE